MLPRGLANPTFPEIFTGRSGDRESCEFFWVHASYGHNRRNSVRERPISTNDWRRILGPFGKGYRCLYRGASTPRPRTAGEHLRVSALRRARAAANTVRTTVLRARDVQGPQARANVPRRSDRRRATVGRGQIRRELAVRARSASRHVPASYRLAGWSDRQLQHGFAS
jgi:hypothetical protein